VTETSKVFGLDDEISLGDHLTTIREQHRNRKVLPVRGNDGPVRGKNPFGHWAVVKMGDSSISKLFPISTEDLAYLRGQRG